MKASRRNLLCFLFLLCNAFAFAQEQDVFHRSDAFTDNWWDSNLPWFYFTSNNNQNRADNNNGGVTRHNVFIGHNNNTGMNVNGAFFTLKSLNLSAGATTSRTFTDDNLNSGLAFTSGIFNNSTATHTFYARIAADANIILNAANGILVFDRQIFTNGNTITFRGPNNINVSGFISQTGNIVKELGGILILSGANTYVGTTTINGGTLRLNRTGGSTIPSTNNIVINSGGILQVSSNQTLTALTVNTGSTLQVDLGQTLTITGAFTGGGTIINNGRIVMAGTAPQSFPGADATITAMNELEINNVVKVNMNDSLTITGSLILTLGNLDIEPNNLLDLNNASLVRTSGFLNGSSTSGFTVRGNTGGLVTIPLDNKNISLRNVTISGIRTVAMNGINDLRISGAFTIASAATFDNGGESQITDGGGTITIDGTFITRDVQGFTGNTTSIPGIVPTLNTGCTIEYGLTGAQAVTTRSDYKNLRFSGSGNKNISSGFDPLGTVFITGNAVVQQGSNSFGDATTNLTMNGGRLVMTGARTSPDIRGVYNLTAGVVEFAGPSNQTIRGTPTYPYQNIEVTGVGVANSGGNINLKSGGTFTVINGGVFTMNDNSIIQVEPGSQTVTVENNAKFVCNDADGFSGTGTSTSVRTDDIETVNLQAGSTIEYGRTTAQVFSARTDYKNVIISGGGAKTLNGAATISGLLTLTSGLVTTTSINLLTMSNTSSVNGASDASFVNGPMKKVGNTAFVFPVGKPITSGPASNGSPTVGGYRPIAISGPSTSTDAFTAEFYLANANLIGPITASGLVRISSCEYWRLDRNTGTSSVNVTLSWTDKSKCNYGNYISDPASVVVVHNTATGYPFGSGNWDAYGRDGGNTGNAAAGTVTWNNVNTFSPFTIGTTDQTANLLPFNLSSFTASPKQQAVQLDWKVANNNEQQEYMLERSSDGINFKTVTVVSAKPNITTAEYRHTDVQPLSSWNYYRLRAKDYQNKTQASQIIKVWMGKGSFISVLPNPASEKIVINLSEPSSILQIQIVNTAGQVLRQLNTIQFLNEINISELQAGMYYIRFLGKDGVTTKSFIKH